MPVRSTSFIALCVQGCLYVGGDDLDRRMDLDGDGIPRPDDCDDGDAGVGAPTTGFVDRDGDGIGGSDPVTQCTLGEGFVTAGGDCDDGNADISPLATETCDGLDDDCDGLIDESDAVDVLTCYWDEDDDGYGASSPTTVGCTCPAGYAPASGDCAAADPTIHPHTPDLCDGIDTDCNGVADDLQTYADADGDGYGDGVRSYVWPACEPPSGYVNDDTDCDDANAEVHPGALEVCDPQDTDEDCNGLADDDDVDPEGTTSWYLDLDGDGYGTDSTAVGACDAPDGRYSAAGGDCDDDDLIIHPGAEEVWYDGSDADCRGDDDMDADADGYYPTPLGGDDCDDNDAGVNPAAVEVCSDGVDNDCDGSEASSCAFSGEHSIEESTFYLQSDEYGALGTSAILPGDLDDDGIADLVTGDPNHCASSLSYEGAAWVVHGPVTASGEIGDTYATLLEGPTGCKVGYAVADGGDLNGDGFHEVFVGGPQCDMGYGDAAGVTFLVSGPFAEGTLQLESSNFTLLGTHWSAGMGWSFSAIDDVTGDGWGDVLAPFRYEEEGSYCCRSAVGLFSGADTGMHLDTEALSQTAWEYGLSQVALLGDWDGDGLRDAVAWGSENVAIFVGVGTTAMLDDPHAVWYGGGGALVWPSAAAPGDTNADGYDDLLFAQGLFDDERGKASLVLGPREGAQDPGDADAEILGETPGDWMAGPNTVGDPNGDGYSDIGLVAGKVTDEVMDTIGAGYLFLGPVSGSLVASDADGVILGTPDHPVNALTGGPDVDADGNGDVLLSSPHGWISSGHPIGTVFLFHGGR